MLFFTYDLEQYRDNLRGFYFDFEAEAPGPLLATSDEVIAAIGNIDSVAEQHRGAYRKFTEKFCPLDDGKAGIQGLRPDLRRLAGHGVSQPGSASRTRAGRQGDQPARCGAGVEKPVSAASPRLGA